MSKKQFLKENQRVGETYAGLILGKNGEKDYHAFLLPAKAEKVTFAEAQELAKKAGGDLPTRREQPLLFANCKEEFEPYWYWSGERHASVSGYAWYQYFDYGTQGYSLTYYQGRARFVRRLVIEN
jgi:hypothetical protein